MSAGLPVSRLINATVNLSPLAAAFANLQSLLIVGDTNVIDVVQRIRDYSSLADVAADFGTTSPEYLAAVLYFEQAPKPAQLQIGRWAQAATAGLLLGDPLTTAEQALSNFTTITTGGMSLTVDGGSAQHLTGVTFASATNMNGVATAVNTVLTGAICSWNASQQRFEIASSTTGAASQVTFATAPGTGVDISGLLGLTAVAGARLVHGVVAETAVACVAALDALAEPWYGIMFAATALVDADVEAVAPYIQGSGNPHIFGVTTQEAAAMDPTSTSDLAYILSQSGYTRTFTQYSQSSPYAAASMFGRFLTTNFNANNSMITMMYKQEPGITPEILNTTQANALEAKRCNVFAAYNNNTAIVQDGVMSGPAYIDEIYGMDWLQNRIQTDVFNALYTSPTKIPQTDAGNHILATVIEGSCQAGVNNGLLAPGTWTSGGFGQLSEGDFLSKGYYVYAPPISSQSPSDRAARKSVTFQVAAKLAGAIHTVDIVINVNR